MNGKIIFRTSFPKSQNVPVCYGIGKALELELDQGYNSLIW